MDISRSTWISQSSYKTFLLTYLDLVIPVPDLLNLWDLLKLHPNNGIKQHNMHNCFNSHFSSRSGLADACWIFQSRVSVPNSKNWASLFLHPARLLKWKGCHSFLHWLSDASAHNCIICSIIYYCYYIRYLFNLPNFCRLLYSVDKAGYSKKNLSGLYVLHDAFLLCNPSCQSNRAVSPDLLYKVQRILKLFDIHAHLQHLQD